MFRSNIEGTEWNHFITILLLDLYFKIKGLIYIYEYFESFSKNSLNLISFSLGMATGRVQTRFFHTRTWPSDQDLWSGLGPFTKQVFFPRPGPGPVKGLGLIRGLTKKKNFFEAQSIKKKIVFLRKKNHSSSAAQTTNPNESQIKSTIPIQISYSQKPNTFEIKI